MRSKKLVGHFHSKIAGSSKDGRQNYIAQLHEHESLTLDHEENNPHDKNAIALIARGMKVGYLNAELAAEVVADANLGHKFACFVSEITGGTSDKPTLGCNILIVWAKPEATAEAQLEYCQSLGLPVEGTSVVNKTIGGEGMHEYDSALRESKIREANGGDGGGILSPHTKTMLSLVIVSLVGYFGYRGVNKYFAEKAAPEFSAPVSTAEPEKPPAPPENFPAPAPVDSALAAPVSVESPQPPVADESPRDRGLVLWKGEWVKPEERIAKRKAEDDAKRAAVKPKPAPKIVAAVAPVEQQPEQQATDSSENYRFNAAQRRWEYLDSGGWYYKSKTHKLKVYTK